MTQLETNYRTYYAIIPATVRYDKALKDKAKLLYGEITALCNDKGYCWAGNSYFAELYGVANETVSRLITNLQNSGYIKVQMIYKNGSKEIVQRQIYISDIPLTKMSIPLDENVNTPLTKTSTPLDENVKENITINNTINIESGEPTPPDSNSSKNKKIKEQPKTRSQYGWVRLTDTQYKKLIDEYGVDKIKWTIEKIDESAEITGNKNEWKNWNLVIRKAIKNNWRFGSSEQDISSTIQQIKKEDNTEAELEKRRQAMGLI